MWPVLTVWGRCAKIFDAEKALITENSTDRSPADVQGAKIFDAEKALITPDLPHAVVPGDCAKIFDAEKALITRIISRLRSTGWEVQKSLMPKRR